MLNSENYSRDGILRRAGNIKKSVSWKPDLVELSFEDEKDWNHHHFGKSEISSPVRRVHSERPTPTASSGLFFGNEIFQGDCPLEDLADEDTSLKNLLNALTAHYQEILEKEITENDRMKGALATLLFTTFIGWFGCCLVVWVKFGI